MFAGHCERPDAGEHYERHVSRYSTIPLFHLRGVMYDTTPLLRRTYGASMLIFFGVSSLGAGMLISSTPSL